jgi:predicted DNA-binding antitoxin AbrB/MazE fold protein
MGLTGLLPGTGKAGVIAEAGALTQRRRADVDAELVAGQRQADALKAGIVTGLVQGLKKIDLNVGEVVVKAIIEARTDEAVASQVATMLGELKVEIDKRVRAELDRIDRERAAQVEPAV